MHARILLHYLKLYKYVYKIALTLNLDKDRNEPHSWRSQIYDALVFPFVSTGVTGPLADAVWTWTLNTLNQLPEIIRESLSILVEHSTHNSQVSKSQILTKPKVEGYFLENAS